MPRLVTIVLAVTILLALTPMALAAQVECVAFNPGQITMLGRVISLQQAAGVVAHGSQVADVGWLGCLGLESTPPAPGDLNGDGVVNTLDLGILLSAWSIPPSALGCGGAASCPADINGDGHVNSLDLGILLSSWTL